MAKRAVAWGALVAASCALAVACVREPTAGAAVTESTATGTTAERPRAALEREGPKRNERVIAIGESAVSVTFEPGGLALGDAVLLAWVERCARAVAGYLGGFPVPRVRIDVRTTAGAGIQGGQAFPSSPPTVRIAVGRRTPPEAFERNWSMTHELVHLAFPDVPEAHHWAEEGLATYVEPIARARAGWITEQAVWAEWIENMPLGLPQPGDGGLDGTESWGRTYWGGALYFLLVDVEIRKQTGGARGLEDALRAIIDAGGNISESWPLERALAAGDRGTGTHVLDTIYREQGAAPVPVDLGRLWRELGVALVGGEVRFDAEAPLAAVRRKIVGGAR